MSIISGDTEVGKVRHIIDGDTYTVSVLLLCTECQQPIKAWINSPQWIRCEWIGPDGQCLACHQRQREQRNHATTNNQSGE